MQDTGEKIAKFTEAQRAEIKALESMTDGQTDFSSIPETTPEQWARAKHGLFYQPDWQGVNLQLYQNVVEWFEERAGTPAEAHLEINRILLEHVRRERHRPGQPSRNKPETPEHHPSLFGQQPAGSPTREEKTSSQQEITAMTARGRLHRRREGEGGTRK